MKTDPRLVRRAAWRPLSCVIPVAALAVLAGCGKSKATDEGAAQSQSTPKTAQPDAPPPEAAAASRQGTPATKADTPLLAMANVRLLQPEVDIERRLDNVDALGDLIQRATDAVVAYDRDHAGALPSTIDVFVVARAGSVRVWVTGPAGDVSLPELNAAFAKLPPIAVREENVAVDARMVRAGTAPTSTEPYLPTSWRQAASAGAHGTSVDEIVKAVWSR